MIDISPPLTPADCDLRDFAFMPLDVVRLRDSDLAVTAEADEFRCAVLLWCASWHQVPAASLPDDDKILAQYAGYGRVVKEWTKVRDGALRGWVKCVDGRLYHPVVAEKASEAWTAKLRQRLKTECARIKKHNERHGTSVQFPDFDSWREAGCPVGHPLPVPSDKPKMSLGQTADVAGENHSKGQGEGQGQGQGQLNTNPYDHPTTAQPEDGRPPEGAAVVTPAGLITMAMKPFGINANPGSPIIRGLAEQGVTPETVAAACQEAKRSKPAEAIGVAYVVRIIERWAREASQLKATGATQPRQTTRQAGQTNTQRLLDRINGASHDADPRIIDINDRPA